MTRTGQSFSFLLLTLALLASCEQDVVPEGNCSGKVVDGIGENRVTNLVFDGEGYVWMTGSDATSLFKTDGENVIQYCHDSSDPESISSDKVNDVVIDGKGVLWLATQKGVDRYDSARGSFEHMSLDDTNSYVLSITSSGEGRVCIATRRNILELDHSSGIFLRKLQMSLLGADGEPDIFFDDYGHLWLFFEGRLDCYDDKYNMMYSRKDVYGEVTYDGIGSIWMVSGGKPVTVDVRTFQEKDAAESFPALAGRNPSSLSMLKKGLLLLKSDDGNVCIDVSNGSVLYLEQASGTIRKALICAESGSNMMAIGPDGSLWDAPATGGFKRYPSISGSVPAHQELVQLLMEGQGRSYVQDSHHFWVIMTDGVHCYDIVNKKQLGAVQVSDYFGGTMPLNMSISSDEKVVLSGAPRSSDPFVILEVNSSGAPVVSKVIGNPKDGMAAFAGQDRIITASRGARLASINGSEVEYLTCLFNDNACYASLIRTLYDGSVLVCYTDHCPVIYVPRSGEVKELPIEGLRQVYFSTFAEDYRGNVWIGSTDNGLFVYNLKSQTISHVDGFPEVQVSSLAADGEGNVFAMDAHGNVYMFNIDDSSSRRVWTDPSDFPPQRQMFTLPDRTVVLVGPTDFVWFNKESLHATENLAPPSHVILTSRKKVIAAFSTNDYTSRRAVIHLDRDIEGLNLHIGAINGSAPNVSYSYMYDINHLKTGPRESFDNAFIPLYGISNLRNNVRFWVKNNNLGTETLPFTIVVKMNLRWQEIAVTLLIIVLLAASAILVLINLRKKREAESERLKREMTERMNMENIDFFANISHEFRTPLTLIHGAVFSLESGRQADAAKAHGVIKRNTDRLLKLVSQMLDFNKLDHGVLKLNVKLEPVAEIFEITKMNFVIGASMKNIDMSLNISDHSMMGWIDRDKIEKILYNLCSNALKYTPPGGAVTIDVSEDENHVLNVFVSDTGIGIPDEDLDAVFDRFYQTDASKKAGGTGIGLSYTRALVNLHHGTIGVRLRKTDDGRTAGSIFSFAIPMSESEYSREEKAETTDRLVNIDSKEMMSEYVDSPKEPEDSENKPKLLIIDDDYEVVYYLKSLFSDNYNVSFRFDAMSGYKLIEELNPDIIICDVMMIDVDGIHLCKMIKDNISMCHIPFVMLTAKSTMEDQIRSLGVGADAYVVKPFNPEYLKALVKSMIDNRNRVRKMLGSSTTVTAVSKDVLSYHDRTFMENMYSAMEESLHKGDMDIDSVAESLGVSRSKFYYKVKALTGQTPNEFFTTYKLNYSVPLIKERKYKIAAIADMLGFSSASHFTSLFKKQFGMLPSQYAESEPTDNKHTNL